MSQLFSRKSAPDARAIDRLVASGRLTEEQGEELRQAATVQELGRRAHAVQLQHASRALADAVAAGKLSRIDADGYLDRLNRGEDAHRVRRELRRAGVL